MSGLPSTFVDGFHDEDAVRKMKYRSVPKFGSVSVLSLGGSGLASMHIAGKGSGLANVKVAGTGSSKDEDIWFMEDAPEEIAKAEKVVVACIKSGINLIDTSHWYGQGRSERLLGHALQKVPRKAYFIITKIGRYDKDPLKMFDFTYQKTYQAGLDSLKRLGCGIIDSLQIHDPEFAPSIEIILEQTIPALQKLKAEGICRYIGITGYPLEVQQEIITRSPYALDTSLTYCHYTLSDTSLFETGHVELCKRKNMCLINAAALAMGLHQGKAPVPDWHPASDTTKALCSEAASYCAASGVDFAKLALHFTTSETKLASTLVSCTTELELQANLSNVLDPLSPKEEQALAYLREQVFIPKGPQMWHGVELGSYWETVGKALITERIYSGGGKRSSRRLRFRVAGVLSVVMLGAVALLGGGSLQPLMDSLVGATPEPEPSMFYSLLCGA